MVSAVLMTGDVSTRLWVSQRLVYQRDTERADLISVNETQTELIAFLEHMLKRGWHIEVTAVRSDHECDGEGVGLHWQGWAVDCWPLNTPTPGDYISETTHDFRQFLVDAISAPFHFQTGLGGAANIAANQIAAGPTWFADNDEDHVHYGVTR